MPAHEAIVPGPAGGPHGPAASAQDDAEGRDKSALRLETMLRFAKEIKVCENTAGKPGPPLPLRPDPLLRYSNPLTHVVDGTLWRWGDRGRPAAVLKLGFRGPTPGRRVWDFKVSALSPKTIEVEFGNGRRWSSRPPGELQPRAVPDAPGLAGSPAHASPRPGPLPGGSRSASRLQSQAGSSSDC